MKIFWAWQSDHPSWISRTLIREALEEAIAILSVVPDIEEPPEAARRTNLELDHDTKGLTGMPDFAASIWRRSRRPRSSLAM